MASAVVEHGFDVAPFVCLSWSPDTRVMVFGDITVTTDNPSVAQLSGAGSRTWVEVGLPAGRAIALRSGIETVDPVTDVRDGAVLAGGFALVLHAVATTQTPKQEPGHPGGDHTIAIPRSHVPEAAVAPIDPPIADAASTLAAIQAAATGADGAPLVAESSMDERAIAIGPDFGTVVEPAHHDDADVTLPPLTGDAIAPLAHPQPTVGEERSALVPAKLCSAGHANPPTAASCEICSDLLAPGTAKLVNLPRPSLGWLELDDGSALELDDELLIGRQPDRDPDASRANLRRVQVTGEKVSRSHVELRFSGWDVFVVDCGSTNGTFVVAHPDDQVMGLEPGQPQLVDPGAVVYFGSRSFTVHERRR